jgi:hypothetical protein
MAVILATFSILAFTKVRAPFIVAGCVILSLAVS